MQSSIFALMMRWDIINALIKQHGCSDYLEIGVQRRATFDNVVCAEKTGVDPALENGDGIISMTSDEYFTLLNPKHDIVFIDGDHTAQQVERDILNAWNCGAKVIILHDCNPHAEANQRVPRETRVWYGDVWRAFVGFRLKYKGYIQAYTVDADCGCGVIIPDRAFEIEAGFITDMPWSDFAADKHKYLNFLDTYTDTIQD